MLLAAMVVLVVAFYWAFNPSVSGPSPGEGRLVSESTSPPPDDTDRPSVLEQRRRAAGEPEAEPADSDDAPSPPAVAGSGGEASEDPEDAPALTGLRVERVTSSELRAAGVPERFKGGVRVADVHPDSPAAEVALEPGDIIVRAQTTMVHTEDELRQQVGQRDYTRVMFVRDGRVLQVVLKPPFDPTR
jgi:membrane-associated protease RseP (regulator of RpoE activity)